MPLQHPSASDATETASIKNSSTAATATTTALVSCFSCLSFSVLIAASLGLGAAAAAAREVDPVVVFSRSGEVVRAAQDSPRSQLHSDAERIVRKAVSMQSRPLSRENLGNAAAAGPGRKAIGHNETAILTVGCFEKLGIYGLYLRLAGTYRHCCC